MEKFKDPNERKIAYFQGCMSTADCPGYMASILPTYVPSMIARLWTQSKLIHDELELAITYACMCHLLYQLIFASQIHDSYCFQNYTH